MSAAQAKAFITDPAGSTSAQDVRDAIDQIYADREASMIVGPGSGATLVGANTATGGSPLSITKPAGTADGDLIVLACTTVNSIPNAAGPGGGGATWERMWYRDTSSNEYRAAWWKVAASEPAAWTLTHSSGVEVVAGAAVWRGPTNLWVSSLVENSLVQPGVPGHPEGLQVNIWHLGEDDGLGMPSLTPALTEALFVELAGNRPQLLVAYVDSFSVAQTVRFRPQGPENIYAEAGVAIFH